MLLSSQWPSFGCSIAVVLCVCWYRIDIVWLRFRGQVTCTRHAMKLHLLHHTQHNNASSKCLFGYEILVPYPAAPIHFYEPLRVVILTSSILCPSQSLHLCICVSPCRHRHFDKYREIDRKTTERHADTQTYTENIVTHIDMSVFVAEADRHADRCLSYMPCG